ncbi:thermonuclease family protein [Chelatococcus sp. SYSU_G07232]|uniref:Thermonuclease family protein n=1 Tax=Chelatococcus albus TaxID=3047466 RepID=A0ABT7AKB2_9HYPH|nr:thermonuclease family protein [Chelatococcus sp. SYSU_G07232]MDJ1159797.1 thermonuclease family protein [Chelatococcus sp. SYSU_G07232]
MNRTLMRPRARRSRRLIDGMAALALLGGLAVLLGVQEKKTRVSLAGRGEAIDGDSLRLGGRELRLDGIDAPELHQLCEREGHPYECGRLARRVLAERLARGSVSCDVVGDDRYGRGLARCKAEGKDLNAALVREGIALAYGAYANEEAEARSARRGLWAGSFERPADWRRRHPHP